MIRPARGSDAAAIAAIYAHHVAHGTASFDTVSPSAESWASKIDSIVARRWPFLVLDDAGSIIGYAYAAQFRDRPAYAATCENSIYLHPDHVGRGKGTMLLEALMAAAFAVGFRQMIAVIGGGEPASVALHQRHGFTLAGRLRDVGVKFGRSLDTVYLQRALTDGDRT